jgi:hypothetical protein
MGAFTVLPGSEVRLPIETIAGAGACVIGNANPDTNPNKNKKNITGIILHVPFLSL